MDLEDHVGDVLMKARVQAGYGLDAVAAVAGLSAAELAELERTGRTARPPNYGALGRLLDLAPEKLEALARGWRPAPVDLPRWRELRCFRTSAADFSVNAYLVWDEVTREAALFDTGFDAAPVLETIEAERLQLQHVFLTHGHSDHVAALEAVCGRHPRARLHSGSRTAPLHQRLRPDEFIPLGNLRISYRETPGHAEDGVTYLIGNWPEDAPPVAVVGDALFAGSMGRVSGDAAAAREVIRRQILSLPPETLLCPGHGPLTTVAEERAHNPFF